MIDFAIARRREGVSAHDAILEACTVRFRPIMMTTLAAILGTLPIALGLGAGAESRQPLGIAVVGGLLTRSEEHTSELQYLMRIPYAVFCLKKKRQKIRY